MSVETPDNEDNQGVVHLPPKYNPYGNRQVWFIETGNERIDDLGNGGLLALALSVPLALAAFARGGI